METALNACSLKEYESGILDDEEKFVAYVADKMTGENLDKLIETSLGTGGSQANTKPKKVRQILSHAEGQ